MGKPVTCHPDTDKISGHNVKIAECKLDSLENHSILAPFFCLTLRVFPFYDKRDCDFAFCHTINAFVIQDRNFAFINFRSDYATNHSGTDSTANQKTNE